MTGVDFTQYVCHVPIADFKSQKSFELFKSLLEALEIEYVVRDNIPDDYDNWYNPVYRDSIAPRKQDLESETMFYRLARWCDENVSK